MQEDTPERRAAARAPGSTRKWLRLLALTALLACVMQWADFPASPLLGAMFAAIVISVRSGGIRLPGPLFIIGQGLIGISIGQRIPRGFMAELHRSWPLFAGGVLWAVVAAALIGLLLTRWRIFPGTTAIWGLSPGAASTMTIMSEDYGGDIRLVAFMQYLRVVCVVLVTSLVARFWVGIPAGASTAVGWFVAPDWPAFGLTLVVVAASLAAGKYCRIPSWAILAPLAAGMLFSIFDLATLYTPPWLLGVGSILLGWSIGLRFSVETLRQIASSFRPVLASILALIFLCAVYAAGMAVLWGVDPLTAYLAASPGGLDSVGIIAASANVDISFVMAMQMARFVVVVMTGPFLARFLVEKARR